MTVAAFLLECEVCHDKMGLLSGAVTSFICFGCAADKVFGTGGQDGTTPKGALRDSSPNDIPAVHPVPAIPPTTSGTTTPTSEPLPTAYVRNDVSPKTASENVTWTPESLKRALQQRTVPEPTYRKLLSYATLYAPWHVFRLRNGTPVLSVRTTWTDAELTEAYR